MITYKWEFPALDCAPLESGLADVIKTIHWRIAASEPKTTGEVASGEFPQFYYASSIGTASLDPVTDTGAFVPFEDVTTGIAAEWVGAKINLTGEYGIYSGLVAEIERQKNPPIVRKQIGVSGSFPV
ncbi:MAG: hypothetical protein FJX80_00285 [Bacteroidetes bacterium]|nr:hypothetical protein [Bacteroidota bacterium]